MGSNMGIEDAYNRLLNIRQEIEILDEVRKTLGRLNTDQEQYMEKLLNTECLAVERYVREKRKQAKQEFKLEDFYNLPR